jgi:hypothetical protein
MPMSVHTPFMVVARPVGKVGLGPSGWQGVHR